jgi:hypothetical protein
MYKLINPVLNPNGSIAIPALILEIDTNTFIQMSEDSTDYQTYLAWVAQGNTPLPADE